jgi:hypothetical protein
VVYLNKRLEKFENKRNILVLGNREEEEEEED